MQAVRQIVDAERLSVFIDIPLDMRYGQVEVLVLPIAAKTKKKMTAQLSPNPVNKLEILNSLAGILPETVTVEEAREERLRRL